MNKYDPKFCDEIIALGKKGYSTYSFADHCGVHRSTLYNWSDQFPEFKDALSLANIASKAFLEQKVVDNLGNKNFQAKGAEFLAKYIHQISDGRRLKTGITKEMSFVDQTKCILIAGEKGKLSVEEVMKMANATANAAKVEENSHLKDELFKIKQLLKEHGIVL